MVVNYIAMFTIDLRSTFDQLAVYIYGCLLTSDPNSYPVFFIFGGY